MSAQASSVRTSGSTAPNDPDRARAALFACSPSVPRAEWVRAGMAAKAAGLDLHDFTEWSAQAPNYKGPADCLDAWKSFKDGGGVSDRTLFYLAQQAGWREPTAEKKRKGGPSAHWEGAPQAPDNHPYILRKAGVPDGLRMVNWPLEGWGPVKGQNLQGWLMVPVRDASGTVQNVQLIGPEGDKLNGAGKMSGTFVLGKIEQGKRAYVVEGIGHAWTVKASTQSPAVVAFGKGNLRAAGEAVKAAGGIPVLVADRGGEADTERAAGQVGATWVRLPEDLPKGDDINDLAKRDGIEAAMKVLQAEVQPPVKLQGVPENGPIRLEDVEVTEDGVARAFTAKYRDALRFDHDAGEWFEWTGDHWRRDGKGRALHYSREMARNATTDAGGSELRTARKFSFARGVEAFARADPAHAVSQDRWDQDPWLLGCLGVTVDLRTGKTRKSDPADGITKRAAVAPADKPACRQWLAFLNQATGGDPEMIRFLQQWAGYSLTGDTREHALVFLYGDGGNGKSVFVNTLSGIMGDYATSAAMTALTASKMERHATELASLRGARLVTASETEEGRAWAESRIKQLTGGDTIKARFVHKDEFEYRPQFKLTVMGNHSPVLHNVDGAMRRRFNIIPFTHKPAVPDRALGERLRDEWPGILRWAIEGALDWQANGLVRPASVAAATSSYFEDQDVFGQFLEAECHVDVGNEAVWEPIASIFEAWRKYAESLGEGPGTSKRMGEAMTRRGFTREVKRVAIDGHQKTAKCYIGVQLRAGV